MDKNGNISSYFPVSGLKVEKINVLWDYSEHI